MLSWMVRPIPPETAINYARRALRTASAFDVRAHKTARRTEIIGVCNYTWHVHGRDCLTLKMFVYVNCL